MLDNIKSIYFTKIVLIYKKINIITKSNLYEILFGFSLHDLNFVLQNHKYHFVPSLNSHFDCHLKK